MRNIADKDIYRPIWSRRSPRLPYYDYSLAGAYFVTVCARGRECRFGDVVNGQMRTNVVGAIVDLVWRDLPTYCPSVETDWYVIMPNHFHGILLLVGSTGDGVGAGSPGPLPDANATGQPREVVGGRARAADEGSPGPNDSRETVTGGETPPLRRPSLVNIMAFFKYETTRRVNAERGTAAGRLWQRSFYDHIIRDEDDLSRAREYITMNPAQWAVDKENVANAIRGNRKGP